MPKSRESDPGHARHGAPINAYPTVHPARKAAVPKPEAAPTYKPGEFLAYVRSSNWPPGFAADVDMRNRHAAFIAAGRAASHKRSKAK